MYGVRAMQGATWIVLLLSGQEGEPVQWAAGWLNWVGCGGVEVLKRPERRLRKEGLVSEEGGAEAVEVVGALLCISAKGIAFEGCRPFVPCWMTSMRCLFDIGQGV